MNHYTIMRFWLLAWATILCIDPAYGQTTPSFGGARSWEVLSAECPKGIEDSRWQRMVGQLKLDGLSAESARVCLGCVQEAIRQGLPVESVLMRIEEGAAKRAGGKALEEVVRRRLQALGDAAAVMRQAGYGNLNAADGRLLQSTAMALESGLSAPTVQRVLANANGGQAERMRSIIEAGESMCLNGMDKAVVGQIMCDFADRNMRRTEVIRASRLAVQQHKAHVDADRIRQQLWDRSGSGGQWERGGNMTGTGGQEPGPAGSAPQSGQGAGASSGASGQGGASKRSGGSNNATEPRGQ